MATTSPPPSSSLPPQPSPITASPPPSSSSSSPPPQTQASDTSGNPPSSSSTPPPQPSPSAASPPPSSSSSSPPPQTQTNDTSANPPSSTTPLPSSAPLPATPSAPPPATPTSPPPATPSVPPPATPSAPPPATPPSSPPATPSGPPPATPSAPPPATPAPPPSSPPPAVGSPPAPASNSPPPAPTLSPPPPPVSFPPPSNSPAPSSPFTIPPPRPPPPPATGKTSPPPSPTAKPPNTSPPQAAQPPTGTPPSPPSPDTPPITTPSAPAPKNAPPGVPSPPSPSPTNSSGGAPVPPARRSPPLVSPTTPSGNAGSPPSTPTGNNSLDDSQNVNGGPGGRVSPSGGGGINAGTTLAIGLVSTLVLLGLTGLVVFLVRKRRKPANSYAGGYVMPSPYSSSHMSETSNPRSPRGPVVHHSSGSHGYVRSPSDQGLGNSKSWFSYEELSAATDGFSTKNLLGEGGFGCVYKGCLQDGREVAVKQLKSGGGQGEREFRAEVEIISRIHHRHLVSLVGYCIQDSQRLLVYDYVPNDTLHYHLHGRGRPVMDWATRVKVAVGASRGLAYLHEDCHPRIIHRDIKSSNILLDSNFEAQVSDFGLARLAMDALTHVTTRVMGTFGYLAPEYALSGKLTDRSDVYSFGVVLLELITGRKPVDDSQPMGDESLVEWARPLLAHAIGSGDLGELPDPRLENNYNEKEMFRMIEAAAACVRHSATMRPRMGQVVRALESLADVDLNNGIIPGQSELFSSQSSEIRLFQRMAFGSQNFSTDFSQASWIQNRSQSHSQTNL